MFSKYNIYNISNKFSHVQVWMQVCFSIFQGLPGKEGDQGTTGDVGHPGPPGGSGPSGTPGGRVSFKTIQGEIYILYPKYKGYLRSSKIEVTETHEYDVKKIK